MFIDAERAAFAGFLAGYRGPTRDVYALDLRRFTGWCRARSVAGPVPRVTRRLSTIAGFYKYAVP